VGRDSLSLVHNDGRSDLSLAVESVVAFGALFLCYVSGYVTPLGIVHQLMKKKALWSFLLFQKKKKKKKEDLRFVGDKSNLNSLDFFFKFSLEKLIN